MRSKFFYLSSLHFLNDGFSAAILLFLPFIAKDLSLNLAQVGVLGAALNLLPIFIALPTAFLAQRFGNFKVMLTALLIYSLGYLLISGAIGFLPLVATFIITGIGFGLFHPIAFSSVSHWSDKTNIGRHMGNFTAWGDVGRLVFTGVLTYLAVAFTWRITVLIYGFLALGAFVYFYFFHFRKNYLVDTHASTYKDHTFGPLFKNKKFLAALACCTFDNLSSGPLFLFLPFLLLSKHIKPEFLSSFAGTFLIGNMLGKAVLGRWVDKLGSAKIFIATEILMAIFILLLTWTSSPWLIAIIAVILGIATRGTVPATRSLVYNSVHDSGNFERANSVVELGTISAAAAAPLLLGIVSNKFGVASAFWACAVFAVLATIPAFVSMFIKDTNLSTENI